MWSFDQFASGTTNTLGQIVFKLCRVIDNNGLISQVKRRKTDLDSCGNKNMLDQERVISGGDHSAILSRVVPF